MNFKLCYSCNEIKPLDSKYWAWKDKTHTQFRNKCRKCTNLDSMVSHRFHRDGNKNKKYYHYKSCISNFFNNSDDYALYWDDEFIAIGSLSYLANFINVSVSSLYKYSSSSYLKETNYHKWVLFKIPDDPYVYIEQDIYPSDNTSLQYSVNLEVKHGKDN